MRVLVEKVFPENEEALSFESWTQVKLKSGLRIELYNQEGSDLRDYIGEKVDCLIYLSLGSFILGNNEDDGYIFKFNKGKFKVEKVNIEIFTRHLNKESEYKEIKGIYKGKYSIPEKYLKFKSDIDLEMNYTIENPDGMFLIPPIEKYIEIQQEVEVSLYVDQFYLIAWLPIE
ncbi:MAG: hypothetical protein ACFFG0_22690 [Candidatus Thorarchaeota archaeon]